MARRLLLLLTVLTLAFFGRPTIARAEGTQATAVPVAVLAFDSEDAEENADGLTGAVKWKVRNSHAWTLLETNQSLGMLTAALRCPSRPTPECQQKIGEQIKQERYLWGFVSRAGKSEVQAEVHLYQRGKPDTVATEKYSANLRDGNDDTLRKIAGLLVDKLAGTALGTLVVKAGSLDGEIVIDGDKRFPLRGGTARIELSPDTHAVELSSPGVPASKKNVLLVAGRETTVDLSPAPTSAPGAAPEVQKPFPTRKVVGGVMMAAGVGLGIFAFERYSKWSSLNDEANDTKLTQLIDDTRGEKRAACETTGSTAERVCTLSKQANTAGITGIVVGSVGGLLLVGGAYVLFTGGDSKESGKAASKKPIAPKATNVSPWLGAGTAGAALSGTF